MPGMEVPDSSSVYPDALMVTSDRGPSFVLPVSEEPRTELGEIQTEISSLAYLEA